MKGNDRLPSGVHDDYKAEAQRLGSQLRSRSGDTVRAVLTDHAQAAARARDDNHVGTEHILLAVYLQGANDALTVLESKGISKDLFESVLDDEPGPSPDGIIPYTVRAMMIGGLAVAEAERFGADAVNEVHLLLGAVAESRRWERQHAWGPHHLGAAAEKASTSLGALEQEALATLGPAMPDTQK
jgi:ATP-dependent Clp protease ATP-binding subunit ClpA